MRKEIERYVLDNAVRYNGRADINAVVGHLFNKYPNLKKEAKKSIEVIKEVINEINKLSLEQQKIKLEKLGKIEKKVKEKERVPEIKNSKNVVTRFAPNPNGPIHIGHCRPAYWNFMLANKYKGKFILRFDDTDPKVKVPMKEAYKWFKEDLNWLGLKPNKVVIQSSRLKIYYSYAEKLIKNGKAYVDTKDVNFMRGLLSRGESSDERDLSPDIQLKKWEKMFKEYKEERAVLRIKTDLKDPNPAIRDWVAFRIVENSKHPLSKEKVWPTLNFASAIDDHEFKVSHIIRGVDLSISDKRQKYIYDYFGWKYPATFYHGKLLISGIKSTSEAKLLIEEGKLSGWDDPRLGTIKSLKRRGFNSEAILKFIDSVGITKTDSKISIEKLASYNKELIDKKTKRYFFIENPIKLIIKDAPKLKVKVPLHPDNDLGFRNFSTLHNFYVADRIKKGKSYRMMHLFNFKDNVFLSKDLDQSLNATLIHWLPDNKKNIKTKILMPNGENVIGLAEPNIRNIKINEIVQFERFGFVKLEKKGKEFDFIFCHK